MAQYTVITAGSPLEIDNTISFFRFIVLSGKLTLQQRVSGTYTTIKNFTAGGTEVFRVGARSGYWNIDEELDAIGFAGTEGINWTTIERHKLS